MRRSNSERGICVAVADDHRHRHRLAERPAEAEDDRADDAERAYGSTAVRIVSQRVAPEREHRLALRCRAPPARTSREIDDDRRQDHDREDHAGGEQAEP